MNTFSKVPSLSARLESLKNSIKFLVVNNPTIKKEFCVMVELINQHAQTHIEIDKNKILETYCLYILLKSINKVVLPGVNKYWMSKIFNQFTETLRNTKQ